MSCWTYGGTIRIISSSDMGTHETYPYCGHVTRQRYLWSRNRNKLLFNPSRVPFPFLECE
jgi:hypothetical protein